MDEDYDNLITYPPRRNHDDEYTANIRLSMFLITGLCAGLPALILAVRSLQQLQGRGVRVSVFIVSLLFSDALELVLIPFIVTLMLKPQNYNFWRIYHMQAIMFTAVRHYGFYLHQLVALEGILSLRNPLCSSRLSSPLVSMPLVISLGICALLSHFLYIRKVLCALICIVAVITCILACKASNSLSYTDMNPALCVTVVAMVTLAFLYGPFFLFHWMCFHPACPHTQPWTMSLSIMSMRLIAEPLLCVLVCREILMTNISLRASH